MYPAGFYPPKNQMVRNAPPVPDGLGIRPPNGPAFNVPARPGAVPYAWTVGSPSTGLVNGYPESSTSTMPAAKSLNASVPPMPNPGAAFPPFPPMQNFPSAPGAQILPPVGPPCRPPLGSSPPKVPTSLTTSGQPQATGIPSASAKCAPKSTSSLDALFASSNLIPDMSQMDLSSRGTSDLLKERHILPPTPVEPPTVVLPPPYDSSEVCIQPDVLRCTLTTVPSSTATLKKARLPLGLVLHPYKDLKKLTILSTSVIVRCRTCRVYINPYVFFPDQQHWRCNLCSRVNTLPEDFYYDPATQTYGDPTRRPEIKNASVEFVAPPEYMARNPPPACYVYVFDVSTAAIETGYLKIFCEKLSAHLSSLPGDTDTLICFIAIDSALHFFSLKSGCRPKHLVVTEVDDYILPCQADVLIVLHKMEKEVREFLEMLPELFESASSPHLAFGSAVSAAHQLIASTGGRITTFLATLPDTGQGSLKNREDPNMRAAKEVQHMSAACDFYKLLALDCTANQVAVDLFVLSERFVDVATVADVSKFTGGYIAHYPSFNICNNPTELVRFADDMDRYLLRKIGFEAVLRIRCSAGFAVHTFFGNHFVRSTDLVVLANVNPDSAMGILLEIDDNVDCRVACFQAALLYTTSHGERRIRVHTICLPTSESIAEIHNGADVQAIIALLARMAADRCLNGGSLQASREALINAVLDSIYAYNMCLSSKQFGRLLCSSSLRLFPLYVLALLKHKAFAHGTSVKLDHRIFEMCNLRIMPLYYLMLDIHPNLYPVHSFSSEEDTPPLLSLSFEKVDRHGIYLMDTGRYLFLYVGQAVSDTLCQSIFGVTSYKEIVGGLVKLPELENVQNKSIRKFIDQLNNARPFALPLRIIKEDSASRELFTSRLVEDRTDSTLSYTEFLQHIQKELQPR
uniref:Protein transport protein Sec24B n=1 Tax=Trichuris muris TaxID=70415 RepID=A0A5S6R125_TRIMR